MGIPLREVSPEFLPPVGGEDPGVQDHVRHIALVPRAPPPLLEGMDSGVHAMSTHGPSCVRRVHTLSKVTGATSYPTSTGRLNKPCLSVRLHTFQQGACAPAWPLAFQLSKVSLRSASCYRARCDLSRRKLRTVKQSALLRYHNEYLKLQFRTIRVSARCPGEAAISNEMRYEPSSRCPGEAAIST